MQEPRANRLLGYPDDARLLIVNADDFGMCHAVNEAILRGLTDGIVTSTTVMTPCPWAPQAMRMLKEHPEIAFGVHLTLVSEFADTYRWGPLAGKERVPSLVDEAGFFLVYDRIPELIARAEIAEVEAEFRAQIEAVLAAGLTPSHLDWHCLADGRREDIFQVTRALAKEYGLAMRIHERAHAEECLEAGLPAMEHEMLDSYRLGWVDKTARYAELLRALPAGLSEWAVHPSLGDAEAQAIEPEGWQIRRADFDFVMSDEARRIVGEEGIVLLNFRALQPFWSS